MIKSAAKRTKWENHWNPIRKIASGGQGNGILVHRHKESADKVYFLKILRDQSNQLSRQRMYSEVCGYEILDHPGIPKLIESNTQFFEDLKYNLYLVTEYIPGGSLNNKITNPINAKKCILRLCEIIAYCHTHDIVHRDIKPNNIILRNDCWDEPILVDFGMAHHEENDNKKANSVAQEVGNRFLRLPEFSIGSALKRDPRSDITHCAGIFFYLLTKIYPSILVDENERMPHQRLLTRQPLQDNSQGLDISKLFLLFDRAFDINIDRRFQSINDLSNTIHSLYLDKTQTAITDFQTALEQIRSKIMAPNQESIRKKMQLLTNIMHTLNRSLSEVSNLFNNLFNTTQTGYTANSSNLEIKNTIGLIYQDDPKIKFIQTYTARIAGNEAMLFAGDEILYRCDASTEDSLVTNDIKNILNQYIVLNINQALKNS